MNKLLKAEKDLNKIVVYCPDNLQVVAMLS